MPDTDSLLKGLDYSILQQCMHCGMCLPTCPTYDDTLSERSSPRGRIALMRAIADDRLEITRTFAEEVYFCLGCLACQTACPAGVDYADLFEHARAEVENRGILDAPKRSLIRGLLVKWLFVSYKRLHAFGKLVWLYQWTGLQSLVRAIGILRLMPASIRDLEPLAPTMQARFTRSLYRDEYEERNPREPKHRVGLLVGCVQDLAFSDINVDTVHVLQQNGCEVVVPEDQECCGSLHAHNGEMELARDLARKNIDAFEPEKLDAIISNAGGCGAHMKHYDRLLAEDPAYSERARVWSEKVIDVHEFLVDIGFRAPEANGSTHLVTYHESCHLLHGQKVADPPREVLRSIPSVEFVELVESDWCCGSAGIYNITQPEMAMKLLDRKMDNIRDTHAPVVATANSGCLVQLIYGVKRCEVDARVTHPISLLADAYRAEGPAASS